MEINVKSLQMHGDDNNSLHLVTRRVRKEEQNIYCAISDAWYLIFGSITFLLSNSLFVDLFFLKYLRFASLQRSCLKSRKFSWNYHENPVCWDTILFPFEIIFTCSFYYWHVMSVKKLLNHAVKLLNTCTMLHDKKNNFPCYIDEVFEWVFGYTI